MDSFYQKHKTYLLVKRVNSFVSALILFIILIPFLFIIFIINLISSKGHPFFIQKRYGYQGKIFNIYKFKSMNEEGQMNKWDRFIRFTSIDELPQLINIIKGDMVFIGPRPLSIEENDVHLLKLNAEPSPYNVKPGLTGYAQIHFIPSSSIIKKVDNDIFYVNNLSISLDIKILFITIFKFLPISIHHKK